jgi:hypothetical protein
LFRTRKIRKEAELNGKAFDDVATDYEQRGLPFKFAERKTNWPWKKSKSKDEEQMGTDEPRDSRDISHEAEENRGAHRVEGKETGDATQIS